ncbi:hypothetical protein AUJ66_04225 [Candidatus Desantisbacteria bacterium CG1_02_38_46]|uniref:ATPase n=1 Tax=Candidatus Desantisbacteria bacterium CG1_02_38_46 TaxID=1817893 RepID=A0A1J4SEQ3_9BACT|nr:MAG: hypothetical protein AUJ66_04225 [Candidatus Desantisbacteria bacterium CG1_02_38_46]
MKKEDFKLLIKEFHTDLLPETFQRELKIPFFSKKIITVYGPRRSGKSFYFLTLIKELLRQSIPRERILYLNFEDDRILPLDFKELNLLLEAYFELYPENKSKEIFLFFDEIQNIKNWEIFVRRIYDRENVRIFITGSSSKLLSKEIATSLRGRTISYSLYPLSFKEFLSFKNERIEKDFEYTSLRFKIKKLLEKYIEWGSFPEIVLEEDLILKRKILSEYFNSLVYRDLSERFSLENTDLLKDLLKFLFTNFTSYFSTNSYFNLIKQKLSVSRETISLYLSYIKETDYFSFLPLFSYSLKVQKINSKKIICLDNGLRNAVAFQFSQDRGKLIENIVGMNLKMKEKEIFFWKNKREVDFILKEKNNLSAVNVCFSQTLPQREIDGLLEVKERLKNIKELILITKDIQKEENGIKFIPLWKWLSV